MISFKYFRHKVAFTMVAFSVFLSVLFVSLVSFGFNKSDDNARRALLESHAERLQQYHAETGLLWARSQLSNIDILLEGRDAIPENIASLSEGYIEDGEDNFYVFTGFIKGPANGKGNDSGRRVHLVHIGSDSEWTEKYETLIYALLFTVGGLVILVGSLSGIALSRKLSEPLQDLTDRIRSTDPRSPNFQPLDRDDEFGEIGQAFSNTIVRINDVLAREKQFSQFASHELRTPVAIIQSSLQLIEACDAQEENPKKLEIKERALARIAHANAQMEDVIQTFLILSQSGVGKQQEEFVHLADVTDSLIEKYLSLQSASFDIQRDYRRSAPIQSNAQAVQLILSNALRNAFAYSAGTIEILISDTEFVIENDIDQLRVEGAEHFGFGLKIVHDLCEDLGWSCTTKNDGAGTFVLRLRFEA